MESVSLVVYHNDPRTAQALVVSLSEHFGPVNLVRRYKNVRSAIARHRASVLVLDLESLDCENPGSNAVRDLHREFPSLRIVATHWLADDQVWSEVMNQGAADVCEPRKEEVIRAVMRERAHGAGGRSLDATLHEFGRESSRRIRTTSRLRMRKGEICEAVRSSLSQGLDSLAVPFPAVCR
jgi:DNA-binding NarL/FixJ family response regulator